jgi:hypothetical protein
MPKCAECGANIDILESNGRTHLVDQFAVKGFIADNGSYAMKTVFTLHSCKQKGGADEYQQ